MTSFTRNLPGIISQPAIAIIGQKCYSSLIEDLDINDVECIKLSVSKGLGIGIVLGGSVVKVPQILLITKSGSARGLSLPAYILETLGYAISLAYSARNDFPFSTYGENLFLTLQNLVVTLLIILYSPNGDAVRVIGASLASAALAGTLLVVSPSTLSLLQLSTLPISLFSKLPQILSNYRARSTGQLSAVAVISQVVGCLARLFTTATEVGDDIVFLGFALALVLNLVISAQMWAYWGKEDVSATLAERKERKEFVDMPMGAPVTWGQAAVSPTIPGVGFTPSPVPNTSSPNRKWARKVD